MSDTTPASLPTPPEPIVITVNDASKLTVIGQPEETNTQKEAGHAANKTPRISGKN